MKITFVTGNDRKFEWAKKRLSKYDIILEQKKMDLIEPREFDVYIIVQEKIKQASKTVDGPIIVEDTSFEIDSLGGFPGTYIKLAMQCFGPSKLCKSIRNHDNRSVRFKSVLGFLDENGEKHMFECVSEGIIPEEPLGDNSHGFGELLQIYKPNGYAKTLAQMSTEELNDYEKEVEGRDHFIKFGKYLIEKIKN